MKVILLCGSVGMHTQSLAGDRMEYIEGKGADHALMVMIMMMMMRRRRIIMMITVLRFYRTHAAAKHSSVAGSFNISIPCRGAPPAA